MDIRGHVGKKHFSAAKHVSFLAIMTALCYVGRLIFQFIPNVQPMTAVIIILSLNVSLADGLIVAVFSIIISNLFLGMGPWTFAQIFAFAFLVILTHFLMKPLYEKGHRLLFIVYSFLCGLLYGFVISIATVKMMGMDNFWAYYFMGIPFDLMHGLGNAGFYFLLNPILKPLLQNYLKKYRYPYLRSDKIA